jgi:hypothetical protein
MYRYAIVNLYISKSALPMYLSSVGDPVGFGPDPDPPSKDRPDPDLILAGSRSGPKSDQNPSSKMYPLIIFTKCIVRTFTWCLNHDIFLETITW